MPTITFNEPFEKEKHVCFFVKADDAFDGSFLVLNEVVIRHYPHPDSHGTALVPVLEEKQIARVRRHTYESSELELLWNQQNVVKKLHGVKLA